jgi:GNAT superfamily N-acetyltransferase
MNDIEVLVSFLRMRTPSAHTVGRLLPGDIVLRRERGRTLGEVGASMYARVGARWHWRDRLPWTAAEWQQELDRDGVELWTAQREDALVGYFELCTVENAVDIRYFGLVPECTGQGLGGGLLSAAVNRAWAMGPEIVTVNTCTLDHPVALANYQARGFVLQRTELQRRRIPA